MEVDHHSDVAAGLSRADEFRRGWKPLLACILGVTCSIISVTFYTQSVFVGPVTESFGWQRGQFQLGFAVMMLSTIATSPIVGFLVDRYGARPVAIIGLVGHSIAYMGLSMATMSLPFFYALWGLLAVLAAGSLPVTWTRVANNWFDKGRGLAIGLTMSGTGIAALFGPAVTAWLIGLFGWRGAYFGLGLLFLVISLPVVLAFFHDRQASDQQGSTMTVGVSLRDAMCGYQFWVFGMTLLCLTLAISGVIPNYVPMLTDSGFSLKEAAGYASLIGLSVLVGRFVAGYLIDFIWAPIMASLICLLPVVSILVLSSGEITPQMAIAAAIAIGLAGGAELDLMAYMTSRYFGMRHYGSVYGGIYCFFALSAAVGAPLYGWTFDRFGTYSPIMTLTLALLLIVSVAQWTMGRYPDFRTKKTDSKIL